jgi:hypothetical protein
VVAQTKFDFLFDIYVLAIPLASITIYEEREIISNTSLITKEKSNNIAKKLNVLILSCKNKSDIKSVLKKKEKKRSSKNKIRDAKRLPCVTICQIGSQKTWAWGSFWPFVEQ